MTQLTQCIATWTAVFAILMSALAPSFSHAVSTANSTSNVWIEICSVTGKKLVQTGDNTASQAPGNDQKITHVEHCPFCLNHAVSLGLPPAANFVMPFISGDHVLPSLFYQTSQPLFAWAAAQPRAPPVIS
ncbi:DUF2946 domain-containing protein [Herminiimonas contaminans]|uniref:DUF2946 domain-containing protein n=2 Tax=Herminiimonas contaminans TaxID=1111140 RepID=A0ABS0EX24_9BURK|nr:DUF2946 domain-containing protein [Herminiimonas contaminans]